MTIYDETIATCLAIYVSKPAPTLTINNSRHKKQGEHPNQGKLLLNFK